MTEYEYRSLQNDMSHKLHRSPFSGNRGEGYEKGILACKSILKNFYEHSKEKECTMLKELLEEECSEDV